MKQIWLLMFALLAGGATGLSKDPGEKDGEEWERGVWVYRGEVFGSIGWAALYHGNHRQFSGLNAVAGVGIRPFKGTLSGLGFEARFAYLGSNVETSSDILILSGSVLYHFSRSKVQPYVLGGFGALRGERTVVVLYASETEIPYGERYQDTLNKIGFEFGGGVKIAITRNLALRPEFRLLDTTPGEGYNLGVPQVNFGVSYHW